MSDSKVAMFIGIGLAIGIGANLIVSWLISIV